MAGKLFYINEHVKHTENFMGTGKMQAYRFAISLKSPNVYSTIRAKQEGDFLFGKTKGSFEIFDDLKVSLSHNVNNDH